MYNAINTILFEKNSPFRLIYYYIIIIVQHFMLTFNYSDFIAFCPTTLLFRLWIVRNHYSWKRFIPINDYSESIYIYLTLYHRSLPPNHLSLCICPLNFPTTWWTGEVVFIHIHFTYSCIVYTVAVLALVSSSPL